MQNLIICCLAQNGSISVNMFSMNVCAFPCSNLHDQLHQGAEPGRMGGPDDVGLFKKQEDKLAKLLTQLCNIKLNF